MEFHENARASSVFAHKMGNSASKCTLVLNHRCTMKEKKNSSIFANVLVEIAF
jgi:hypothetical protein